MKNGVPPASGEEREAVVLDYGDAEAVRHYLGKMPHDEVNPVIVQWVRFVNVVKVMEAQLRMQQEAQQPNMQELHNLPTGGVVSNALNSGQQGQMIPNGKGGVG